MVWKSGYVGTPPLCISALAGNQGDFMPGGMMWAYTHIGHKHIINLG